MVKRTQDIERKIRKKERKRGQLKILEISFKIKIRFRRNEIKITLRNNEKKRFRLIRNRKRINEG